MIKSKLPKPKKCAVPTCKALFTPSQPFVTWCSFECGAVIAQDKLARKKAKAALQDRRETKEKLEKLKTIAQLIADAQVQFNTFIRMRDKDKGCFVCGRPFKDIPGQVQHAGHVRSRGAAGHLRFNEDNCHGECEGCNGPYGAKPHQITAGAVARIGPVRYYALEVNNKPHKWQRQELLDIKAHYAAKIKELKAKQ